MLVAVCDDDALQRENLCGLLETYFSEKQVKPQILSFTCGEELVQSSEIFDMAFLDVEMGYINGIRTGQILREKNANIILFIITAHDEYLDEAFDLHAFRYIQKPVESKRLFKSIDTAMERNYTMVFESDSQMIRINIYDIVCVYADDGRTVLVTDTKLYHTKYTLSFWREKLYYDIFAQPHNSYLVNLKYVVQCAKDSVVLRYGENQNMTIYISQRKYQEFRRSLFRVVEGRK